MFILRSSTRQRRKALRSQGTFRRLFLRSTRLTPDRKAWSTCLEFTSLAQAGKTNCGRNSEREVRSYLHGNKGDWKWTRLSRHTMTLRLLGCLNISPRTKHGRHPHSPSSQRGGYPRTVRCL